MSRIGKQPISIPTGTTIDIKENLITVTGAKGELKREIHPNIKIEVKDNEIIISRSDESNFSRALHGLSRSLIANMVEGVTKGYEKKLEIVGIGYRAKTEGKTLVLSLGFSHPINFPIPEGIEIKMDEDSKNKMIVAGINKELVGEVAAKIRAYKRPEPYKGKGIKYENEHIRRKAGKTAAK